MLKLYETKIDHQYFLILANSYEEALSITWNRYVEISDGEYIKYYEITKDEIEICECDEIDLASSGIIHEC